MSKLLTKQKTVHRDRSEQEYNENLRVLFAMMTRGNKSDRKIAKMLGVSNTTLSRRRKKLEEEGYIKEYTLLPDLQKIGFEYIGFTFASTNDMIRRAPTSDFSAFLDKYPELICITEDQGLSGTSWVGISVHNSYDDFAEMFKKVQNEPSIMKYRPQNMDTRTIMFRTSQPFLRPFSMRNLEAAAKKPRTISANHAKS